MSNETDRSRRLFLEKVALGVLTVSAAGIAPAAQNKVDKQQAQYQESPKGDRKCASCIHYQAESGQCAVVAGDISPDAWCALYAPKPSS